jgi:hypothetical protein
MPIIEVYPSTTSVTAGETIDFHVFAALTGTRRLGRWLRAVRSGRIPFRVEVYREGAQRRLVRSDTGHAEFGVERFRPNCFEDGCGWPVGYRLHVPANWSSGVYTAECSLPGTDADLGKALFIVKPVRPTSTIAMSINVATYQAYNMWGGRSLYGKLNPLDGEPDPTVAFRTTRVSFDRPYLVGENARLILTNYFDEYELRFVKWLESESISVDFYTSVDLHERSLDSAYHLLVIVGHDEYWSRDHRAHVEEFIAGGGNLAVFAGNTCWWQVRYENDNHTMVCYKDTDSAAAVSDDPMRTYKLAPKTYIQPLEPRNDPYRPLEAWEIDPESDPGAWYDSAEGLVTANWKEIPWGLRPELQQVESSFLGVSFQFGGGFWEVGKKTPILPFTVSPGALLSQFAWVFDNTGLVEGEEFGLYAGGKFSVIDRECDGAEYRCVNNASGQLVRDRGPGAFPHEPAGLTILAQADLAAWRAAGGAAEPCDWVTMTAYQHQAFQTPPNTTSGVVFNAATTNWCFGLGDNPEVDQITRNVLSELG